MEPQLDLAYVVIKISELDLGGAVSFKRWMAPSFRWDREVDVRAAYKALADGVIYVTVDGI